MIRVRIALFGLLALQSFNVHALPLLPPGILPNGIQVRAGMPSFGVHASPPLDDGRGAAAAVGDTSFVGHTSHFNDIRQTHSRFFIVSLAAITVAVGASSVWALVERYRKNKAVESHKRDKQIIRDRQFLSELAMYIEQLEEKYSKERPII